MQSGPDNSICPGYYLLYKYYCAAIVMASDKEAAS